MPKFDLSKFRYEGANPYDKAIKSPPCETQCKDSEIVKASEDPKDAWPDILGSDLLLVFVGFNPGVKSGETGYHYAHASNRFWKLLHESGLTGRQHQPSDDTLLPGLYKYGFSDLVARCTRNAQELSVDERLKGARILDETMATASPLYVCLVGKGIWQSVCTYKGWKEKPWAWGLQPESCILGTRSRVFVVPSTSGLVSISKTIQLDLWSKLAQLIEQARESEMKTLIKAEYSPA